jgi:endogenous inhibitor of DNA gyrase (YacG/DUF329 family)
MSATTDGCPICGAPREPYAANRYYPFCSKRCKVIDLGHWLNGDYVLDPESGNLERLDPDAQVEVVPVPDERH